MPDENRFRIIGYAADWEGPVNPAQTAVSDAYQLCLPARPTPMARSSDIAHPRMLEDLVRSRRTRKT